MAEDILTDRAYQQKLALSASLIENHFNDVRIARETPPSKTTYISVAKASDLSLPPDTRVKALERLHTDDPRFGKELAATLALDTECRPEFTRALRMIRVMEGKSVPSGAVGCWPLLLLDPQLAAKFGGPPAEEHRESL